MLLIDAFNVIRAQWALPPARRGMDIPALIARIGRSRFAHRRLRVVADGLPTPQWARTTLAETLTGLTWARIGRAEVVFSGREQSADDIIEDILARSRGIQITVVSSDRRLIRAAGRAGADQIGNGSFLRLINEDMDRRDADRRPAFAADVPLDQYSIAHWMREFGYGSSPVADGGGGTRSVTEGVFSDQTDPPEPLDPLLRDAFEDWHTRLTPEDLDMRRWIDGVQPL